MRQGTASLSMVGIPLEQVGAIKKIFEDLNQALKLGANIVEEKENVKSDNSAEIERKLEVARSFFGRFDDITATDEEIKEVRALTRLRA